MHTWQTALRGVAANWTLLEYFQKMHAGLATVFTAAGPAHRHAHGRAEPAQLRHHDAGRLVPQQPDAGAQRRGRSTGLLQAGIRAAFFHGTPKPDPKPGQVPFWEVPHPRAEVERLLKAHQGHALLSIQAAVLGPHYSTLDVAMHDFRMARELGLIASLHQGGGAGAHARRLGAAGGRRAARRPTSTSCTATRSTTRSCSASASSA